MHVCFACDRVVDFALDDAEPVRGRPRYVHRTAHDCARARPVAGWDVYSLRRHGAAPGVDAEDPVEELDAVDAEEGLLLIKGAVPGPRGSVVLVRTASKTPAKGANR